MSRESKELKGQKDKQEFLRTSIHKIIIPQIEIKELLAPATKLYKDSYKTVDILHNFLKSITEDISKKAKESQMLLEKQLEKLIKQSETLEKKQTRTKEEDEILETLKTISKIKKDPILIMPSSPVIHLTNRVINALGQGRMIRNSKNRNNKYTIKEVVNNQVVGAKITSANKDNRVTVTIDNIKLLKQGNNKGLSKIFAYTLKECNKQNYNKEISFSLQELVNAGLYSSIESSRTAIKKEIIKIMSFTFNGECNTGKKIIEEQGGKLIYHYKIKNNYVTLYFNENLNIKFLAQYYTILPDFAFRLNSKAFNLVCYIFFLARQNTKKIVSENQFNISIKAIHDYLALPDPNEITQRKYKQYITDPIEESIDEIMYEIKKEKENHNIDHFEIKTNFKQTQNITEWLNEGYLGIKLNEIYTNYFKKIEDKTELINN